MQLLLYHRPIGLQRVLAVRRGAGLVGAVVLVHHQLSAAWASRVLRNSKIFVFKIFFVRDRTVQAFFHALCTVEAIAKAEAKQKSIRERKQIASTKDNAYKRAIGISCNLRHNHMDSFESQVSSFINRKT